MPMSMLPGAQASPTAGVRRVSGEKAKERAGAGLDRRTGTEEELGKAKESPLSAASVKSAGSDAERPPSSAVSTIADDR